MSESRPVTERRIATNRVQLHTLEAGEAGAPVVVLAHGLPETSYSWRHQIPVLAAAGCHVLAPQLVTGRYRELVIDGAGHWLQQEKSEQVNELLLDFLSNLKPLNTKTGERG